MCTVYVLENDLVAQRALMRSAPDYEMQFFSHEQALKQALSFQTPRAILCNLQQDQQKGYAFARWLKNSDFAELPLVWLSPRISWRELKQALEEGAKDCVFKPFSPSVFNQWIARSFISRCLMQEAL